MTNSKMTKRALLTSIMALMLCFAMLTGTTFAWFTDQETSANNKIIAGNLDVDLLMYKVENGAGEYKSIANESGAIFGNENSLIAQNDSTNTLWEPGKTQVVFLAVENKGNLALKYNILVNVVDGGLIGALEYAILDGVTADAVDLSTLDWATIKSQYPLAIGDVKAGLTVAAENGTLDEVVNGTQNERDYFALAVHMKEEADNNYMSVDGDKKSITIDVTVTATQVMAEADSFDNTYDDEAKFEVSTPTALVAALAKGGVVVLDDNIEVDATVVIPEGAEVTLDLNGKTLTGTMHKNDGAVVKNQGTLTITNGTISSTADNGGSAIMNAGTLTVKDSILNGAPNANGSWPSYTVNNTGVMTIINTKITSYHGSVASYNDGAIVTLKNSEIAMVGIPGFTNHGVYTYSNGKVVINGGTYVNAATDQNSTGGSVINGAVEILAGTFSGRLENYSGTPVIKGGTFNADPTRFVADGHVVTNNNDGTWTVDREYTQVAAPSTDKNENGQALANAIIASSGATFIKLGAGEYKMPTVGGSNDITIVGTTDTIINVAEQGVYMDSSNIAFEGVTIKGSTGIVGSDYIAIYSPNVTYTNCVFDGSFRIGRDGATFINCTFTNLGNDYVWTYGNDVTFKGCTFNTDGKAILVYNDGGTEVAKVVVEDCVFNATNGAKAGAIANQNCAAIEIQNYGHGVDLVTSGNTIDSDFSGEWRIKTYHADRTDVIVNGVEYNSIAIDGKTMTIDADKNVTIVD